jgi:hypothetical protein
MATIAPKKTIVITTIFSPTDAVVAFSKLNDYNLIVIGDKKTPNEWACNNVEYIPISAQEKLPFELSQVLPYNHYCRKMLGYLIAIENGAEYIIDTDDDNLPKDNWHFPTFDGTFRSVIEHMGFVNIYQLFTKQKIWPRGLPLNFILKDFELEKHLLTKNCKIGIWQGLADEDPDVDAIYRLTINKPCYFNNADPVVLGGGTISPFNTQNTIICKELFALLYLPTYVTFRFTDILRALVAQPIMWLYDYQLGFINATVVQKRNPHNYFEDFLSEIPMYESSHKIISLVEKAISVNDTIETNLYNAYQALHKAEIVCVEELQTLTCWLNDIENLSARNR